ncbi:DEAD/DEAH box helicase [Leptolyngbya sp. GGD]|uniref:DEAD/DEAH box helicase n=1 Tax=Leptolyngbya sp. GGD TaxID=2997907 RepID=UPI00227B1244|nr:DEAD/DEAH box helicase [Leptolyngbya sp. GGD]MCY6493887.1 caspase family protein [Leptolyngbya sp. GGD]
MVFRGLFVGIDQYAASEPFRLSCAKRDATALHALFYDTLGGNPDLLVDQEATASEIRKRLNALTHCEPDDVVVISFSGHGTDTHHLVTHDTSLADLENTSIALDALMEMITRIPARRLICFLDCCFSGGLGAKVLHIETVPRNSRSVETPLAQLSGEGRLILTASSPTEEASENLRLRHGLLTYFLLEALQGAPTVQQNGQLPVYRLLEYVTRRVIDASTQLGKPQHPTLRGQIEGEFVWPIFRPGDRYRAMFPERIQPRITANIHSLEVYGFPSALLNAWAGAIPSLNPMQLEAIQEYGLLEGQHLAVSAPTSSGKTLIGELAALKGVLDRQRAIFLLPLKALVSDKYHSFTATYGDYGIVTVQATGETDDITPLLRGQFDIGLLTYEKFTAIALAYPHILSQVGTVIVDEVQMVADDSRGVNLEFILTLLKIRRKQGIEPQIITLSAVIGETNGLERWLGAQLLRYTMRPVPLDEGILLADGRFRFIDGISGQEQITEPLFTPEYRKGRSQDWIIPLVQKLVSEGQQVIVFRETKGEARGCALYLARELGLSSAQATLDTLPTGDASRASQDLALALQGGVAFHTSELAPEERRVIEEQFRADSSSIRVIAATTTLAMGVNTPAYSVVIVGLQHPIGGGAFTPYSVAEYKNLVGRAGRQGYTDRGTSYLLALTPHDAHYYWTQYVKGSPENIASRFLNAETDPRSLIIRVLAAVQQLTKQGVFANEIIEFLESSFGAFQQMQVAPCWSWNRIEMVKALEDLLRHQLVEKDANDHYYLTEIGQLAGQSGVEVESIIRIVDCLSPLNPDSINDPTLLATTQMTVELDQVLFPINKRSTNKEPHAWKQMLMGQDVPEKMIASLTQRNSNPHQGTLRAKKAIACLLFITPRTILEIETMLTQFGGATGGAAGAIREVTARTCDLLPLVVQIAGILHPTISDLDRRLSRLLIRLTLGIPSTAVDVAQVAGSKLTRADYLQLCNSSYISIDKIESSGDDMLLPLINQDVDKLAVLRQAVNTFQQKEYLSVPPLEQYEA